MRRVARLAQERRTHLQHAFCGSAMRVVAGRAVLADGLMLMHERSAFLHMAGVTGFVYAIAFHELRTGRSMHIVAVRARHLAFHNRMVRRLVDLWTLFLVAGKTNLSLGEFVAHHIFCRVNLVATGTRNIARLMGTSFPVRAISILVMAVHAHAIADFHCIDPLAGKQMVGLRANSRIFGLMYMPFACTVTSGASRRATVC